MLGDAGRRSPRAAVPGLTATPARAPAARMSLATMRGLSRRLDVERHAAGAGLGVARRPAVGVVDHQVAVGGDRRCCRSRLSTTGRPKVRFGHEVVVHHVEVDPVGRRAATRRTSAARFGEVGVQDARRDLHAHAAQPIAAGRHCLAQDGEEHRVGAVAVRPQLDGRPVAAVGRPRAAAARASSWTTSSRPRRTSRHHELGLGQVRRAGHVGDDAAGPGRVDARPAAGRAAARRGRRGRPGVRRQRDSGRRRSAPRPVQGASTSTRSNCRSPQGACRASPVSTLDAESGANEPLDQVGPMRMLLDRDEVPAALRGRARRAGRPCRRVRRRRRATRPSSPATSARVRAERDQLAALVLDARAPVAHARERVGGAVDERAGERRPAARLDLGQVASSSSTAHAAGRATRVGRAGGVVGGQQVRRARRAGRRGRRAGARTIQAGCDQRVRQPVDVVGGPVALQRVRPTRRRRAAATLRSTALTKPARASAPGLAPGRASERRTRSRPRRGRAPAWPAAGGRRGAARRQAGLDLAPTVGSRTTPGSRRTSPCRAGCRRRARWRRRRRGRESP